jgi:hypothetical protein
MRKFSLLIVACCIVVILFSSCYMHPSPAEIANFDYGEYPTKYAEIIKGYLNEIFVDS